MNCSGLRTSAREWLYRRIRSRVNNKAGRIEVSGDLTALHEFYINPAKMEFVSNILLTHTRHERILESAMANDNANASNLHHVVTLIDKAKQQDSLISDLQARIQTLEDKDAIKTLHYTYGYYIDKCLYTSVVDLFSNSPDASIHFLNGIWKGKAGITRLYVEWFGTLFTDGRMVPAHGLLLDHLLMQDVVTILPSPPNSDEPRRAKGRFRNFMMGGTHSSVPEARRPKGPPAQFWEGGIYENEYIFENNRWKIFKLGYNMLWQADYEKGWADSEAHLGLKKAFPEDKWGPDELLDIKGKEAWPATRVVPFHYNHPVTGEAVGMEEN